MSNNTPRTKLLTYNKMRAAPFCTELLFWADVCTNEFLVAKKKINLFCSKTIKDL